MVEVRFHVGHIDKLPTCPECGRKILPGSEAQSLPSVHATCWRPELVRRNEYPEDHS